MYRLADVSSDGGNGPVFFVQSPSISTNDTTTYNHHQPHLHKKMPIHGADLFFRMDPPKRYIWGLHMFIALFTSLFFSWKMMMLYLENKSATHITAIQNDTLILPTIYACPKNPDSLNYDVLFNDIFNRTGISNYNASRDILLYFIAGSGFQNTNVNTWEQDRILQTEINFAHWRGNRSNTEMFDFVFSKNGITCKDIFTQCVYGEKQLNCCEIFTPSYVLMRGRCMRLSRFKQQGAAEGNKLILSFAQPESRLVDDDLTKQFVIYLGDDYPEIAMYPRLYLTYAYVGKLRLKPRQVHMNHRLDVCNFDQDDKGKYTCFVNHWLLENLIGPYNCTLPYYSKVRVAQGRKVCDTELVVRNYQKLLTAGTINYRRWDYFFKYSTIPDPDNEHVFNMEIYYPDVFYEIYSEIQITSWTSFISQVGGQIVLFLGTSIISLVYVLTAISSKALFYCRKWFWRRRLTMSSSRTKTD